MTQGAWMGAGYTADWNDLPGVRVCRVCGKGKSLAKDYAGDAKDRKGKKTVCKDCDNRRRRALGAAQRAKALEAAATLETHASRDAPEAA